MSLGAPRVASWRPRSVGALLPRTPRPTNGRPPASRAAASRSALPLVRSQPRLLRGSPAASASPAEPFGAAGRASSGRPGAASPASGGSAAPLGTGTSSKELEEALSEAEAARDAASRRVKELEEALAGLAEGPNGSSGETKRGEVAEGGSRRSGAPPARGALAARKKLGLKKSMAAKASLARTAQTPAKQKPEAPPTTATTTSKQSAPSRSSGGADHASRPPTAASSKGAPAQDIYRIMRIKVMPLMRSWVTVPKEADPGDFSALAELCTTDAKEVYVTYQRHDENGGSAAREPAHCHKPIFVLSDCTGESAAKTVRGALSQFQSCNQAVALPTNMVIFRFLDSEEKAVSIVERASHEGAMIVFTLVDPVMVDTVKASCKYYSVRCEDLWGKLLDSLETHLGATPARIPLGSSAPEGRKRLSRDYFKLISAVEYTRRMDDGANPQEWKDCDLMVLGASRSGKTPLCIYLGQRGYKVANLPLVPNLPIPKELFGIDQRKIVGLTMDPSVLHAIRTNRMETMGVGGSKSDYVELSKVREEMTWVKQFYARNPKWLVLDSTYRSVEESAARILRVMNERLGEEEPMWSGEISGEMMPLSMSK